MSDKVIQVDLHGDYPNMFIGKQVKAGDVLGTCNGHPNFSPHRHLAFFKANDTLYSPSEYNGQTYEYLYANRWESLDPISFTPDWFNAGASGFAYMQWVYDWYINNMGINVRNQGWYVANNTPKWDTSDTFHDGSDIGTGQGIYKGSDLVAPFDGVVIDVGTRPSGLTFLIIAVGAQGGQQSQPQPQPQQDNSGVNDLGRIRGVDMARIKGDKVVKVLENLRVYAEPACVNPIGYWPAGWEIVLFQHASGSWFAMEMSERDTGRLSGFISVQGEAQYTLDQ